MYWDNPAEAYGARKKEAGPYSEIPGGQYAFRTDDFELSPVRAATEGLITLRAPRRNAALLGQAGSNVARIFEKPWISQPKAGRQVQIPQFTYSPKDPDALPLSQYGELLTKDGKKLPYSEKTSLRQ